MGWVIVEGFMSETSAQEAKKESRCWMLFNVATITSVNLQPTRLGGISVLRIAVQGEDNFFYLYNKLEINVDILNDLFELTKG